jgi:hypothetical protein
MRLFMGSTRGSPNSRYSSVIIITMFASERFLACRLVCILKI